MKENIIERAHKNEPYF